MNSSQRQKTSIRIDPDIWQKVKLEAVRRRRTVAEIVEEALRVFLGKKT